MKPLWISAYSGDTDVLVMIVCTEGVRIYKDNRESKEFDSQASRGSSSRRQLK